MKLLLGLVLIMLQFNSHAFVKLASPIKKEMGSFEYQVRLTIPYEDIDWNKSQLLRNGYKISWPRFQDGIFYISEKNLPRGKYSYEFQIKSKAGGPKSKLFIPVWPDDNFRWENGIMYQIMIDRFFNGDPTNDRPSPGVHMKSNWQGGDFKGIERKIREGYFQKLGSNILYISSPIINTPGSGKGIADDFYYSGYHSYWPIGIGWTDDNPIPGLKTPIEPHFGTRADLKRLVNLAHAHGIRVVVDFVANHLHSDSPHYKFLPDHWFNELYICGWERPLRCWFTDYLPDFNYDHQEVVDYIVDHALWIIKEFNIDGFRVDAVKHMNMELTTTLKSRIKNEIEHTGVPFYMVGETFTGDQEFDLIGDYIGPHKLNGQFDFPLYYHINRTFFIKRQGFKELYEFLKENEFRYQKDYYPRAIMSNFLGNHDIPRAASIANGDFGYAQGEFGGDVAKWQSWHQPPPTPTKGETFQSLKQAWTLLMSLPGIPLIYQGDEIGMAGAADPDNRRMMQFGEALSYHQRDLGNYVAKLTQIRKSHPALGFGKLQELWMSDDTFVYSMKYRNDYVIIAMNRGTTSKAIQVNLHNVAQLERMRNELNYQEVPIHNQTLRLNLPPGSVEIYSK